MSTQGSTTWTLPADPATLSMIRNCVVQELIAWGHRLDVTTIENLRLVVSELVTNAIVHAGEDDIGVTVWAENGEAYLEVQDRSLIRPCIQASLDTDESGRGLFLVESLSSDWGTDLLLDGKRVWARMRLYAPKSQPSRTAKRHLASIIRSITLLLSARLLPTG
ncbi:Anti-sigma regulatory factor (Ser/Thr protein kinase) [Sinosporangium album]|uniref:Anti-sigma regulatory factor (Ser/Thr protein kinase) n=1 Tax=Sinosporangium album TaxID=504805 RepID=A0A1G7QME3_9ACTN|nr:ATP-binding protein [Sinosporangium album]SDF99683.1 Anti-sigma regulatory factor (Ser/Thr protein kinase) [Sinosporangium album]